MPGIIVVPGSSGGGAPLATTPPPPVGATDAAGTGSSAARDDHQHAGVNSLGGAQGTLGLASGDGAGLDFSGQNLRANITVASQAPGDIITRGASTWQRTAVGTTGQVLGVSGGAPTWQDFVGALAPGQIAATGAAGSSAVAARADHTHAGVTSLGGLAGAALVGPGDGATVQSNNGTNTLSASISVASQANGDLITRAGGAWARLAIGTSGQVLTVVSGAPVWGSATLPVGSAGSVYASDGTTNSFTAAPNIGGTLSVGGSAALALASSVLTVGGGATSGINLGGAVRNVSIANGTMATGVNGVISLGTASAQPSGSPPTGTAWMYTTGGGNFWLDAPGTSQINFRISGASYLTLNATTGRIDCGVPFRCVGGITTTGGANLINGDGINACTVGSAGVSTAIQGNRVCIASTGAGANAVFFGSNAPTSGAGVIAILNCTTVPASNQVGGGILYVEAGALKFRGGVTGAVTTLGPA